MRILLDHGAPYGLARYLEGHTVSTAHKCGWDRLTNGDLLRAAEQAGFDLLLTNDKNLRYQQNLSSRRIALIVLGNSSWLIVRKHLTEIVIAVGQAWNFRGSGYPASPQEAFCPPVENDRRRSPAAFGCGSFAR